MIQLENAVERYGKIILTELKEVGINTWIAGGAIRDYFMGVKIKTDYDLFFPNQVEYEKCKTYFNAKGAEVRWESDNGMKVKYNGKTFDLVKKYFETPQATIDNFDFTVSMFAVDYEKVYFGETTFIDLAKRQLMLNKIPYPASTMSRAFRYYGKGFKMCLGEMKKLCEAIQAMPPEEKQDESVNTDNPPSGDDTVNYFVGID
ncbi:hypothetical protein [uncultured Flavobacterium sp.]|uniref:hypothetical protein n=1 Tax=uncultured Flavobacterium sp. TaxID=165435 RepID=UPI0025931139|nr:hypothetical protein [uncultured Flavobacterium sp.]